MSITRHTKTLFSLLSYQKHQLSAARWLVYLDLLGSREATRPGSVYVPGETVNVSRDVTGHPRVFVPVPGTAHLPPLLQDLVSLQANIVQFLGRTQIGPPPLPLHRRQNTLPRRNDLTSDVVWVFESKVTKKSCSKQQTTLLG